MKILLINVHSFHNAGDFALTLQSLQQLYRLFPGCRITIAMNDPASYPRRQENVLEPDSIPDVESVVPSFFAWFRAAHAGGVLTRYIRLLLAFLMLAFSILLAIICRLSGIGILRYLPQPYERSLNAYFEADLVVSVGGNFIYSRGHKLGLPLLMPLFTILYGWLCGKPLYMLPQTVGPISRAGSAYYWVLR